MQSVLSIAVKTFLRTFRQLLFIHKTEPDTLRIGFERASNITKFPQFVKKIDLEYAGLDASWFIPENFGASKTILYIHGGGYVMGSVNTHRALIARIARASGYRTLAINYRKAPEFQFPAALDDVFSTYQQLVHDGYENIFVMGDSAGGGLSLSLIQMVHKFRLPKISGAVLLSPWTDLTLTGDSMETKKNVDPMVQPYLVKLFVERYCGNQDVKNPLISPLFANFNDFPPIYIQVGDNETLLDDSTRLARKLYDANIDVTLDIYPEMMHVWQFFGGLMPEANKAIEQIGNFVKSISVQTKSEHLDALEIY
jgi:monoterpene epsilon-lactone hydrolase